VISNKILHNDDEDGGLGVETRFFLGKNTTFIDSKNVFPEDTFYDLFFRPCSRP
jgi:hypothetical protein